jgi:hypothetical protein
VESQRKRARAAAREAHQTYAFWFRNRYRLSPRDPRFLELTPEEVEADYWSVQFHERPEGAGEEFEDDEFEDEAAAALERLESGEGWETVVDDLFGRDDTVG